MSTPAAPASPSRFLDQTHEVINVSSELAGYNMYTQDAALREAVQREGAAWAQADLTRFGQLTGSADYLELGALANRYPPELDTHDRFGHRVDLVRFHPAYHTLMKRPSRKASTHHPGPILSLAPTWPARPSSTCRRRWKPATVARSP